VEHNKHGEIFIFIVVELGMQSEPAIYTLTRARDAQEINEQNKRKE